MNCTILIKQYIIVWLLTILLLMTFMGSRRHSIEGLDLALPPLPPRPPTPSPTLVQLLTLGKILNDTNIPDNKTRMSAISSSVGHINQTGDPVIDRIVAKMGNTSCNVMVSDKSLSEIIQKAGCDHKTGNFPVDNLIQTPFSNEGDATKLVNALRLLCADAISSEISGANSANAANAAISKNVGAVMSTVTIPTSRDYPPAFGK